MTVLSLASADSELMGFTSMISSPTWGEEVLLFTDQAVLTPDTTI